MDWILTLINWNQITATGVDATVYFAIAAISTVLFLLRLGAMAIFGGDSGDVDIGGDFDPGDFDSSASFGVFSVLSVLGFLMGMGWMGLTARVTWELGSVPALGLSVATGLVFMFVAAGMMYQIHKMEHVTGYDTQDTVGHTGRVYLTIPGDGKGVGQVEINVSGRRMVVSAKTRGEKIDAFETVKVIEVADGDILIVERI